MCSLGLPLVMDFASWQPLAIDRGRARLEALFNNNDNNIVADE